MTLLVFGIVLGHGGCQSAARGAAQQDPLGRPREHVGTGRAARPERTQPVHGRGLRRRRPRRRVTGRRGPDAGRRAQPAGDRARDDARSRRRRRRPRPARGVLGTRERRRARIPRRRLARVLRARVRSRPGAPDDGRMVHEHPAPLPEVVLAALQARVRHPGRAGRIAPDRAVVPADRTARLQRQADRSSTDRPGSASRAGCSRFSSSARCASTPRRTVQCGPRNAIRG